MPAEELHQLRQLRIPTIDFETELSEDLLAVRPPLLTLQPAERIEAGALGGNFDIVLGKSGWF